MPDDPSPPLGHQGIRRRSPWADAIGEMITVFAIIIVVIFTLMAIARIDSENEAKQNGTIMEKK